MAAACPELEQLEIYVSDGSSLLAGSLREHISSCGDCQARLTELSANRELFNELSSAAAQLGARPAPAAAPPSRVGEFDILREVGRGGMGVVYEARQRHPQRRVALKVVRGDHVGSDERLRLFQREIRALARLRHSGIASIYEAGASAAQPFYAMEFVQGEALTAHAQRLNLDQRARLAVFLKLCAAISYAHQRGVIHRDLKPGNVLIEEDGTLKVLDFGLARITDNDVTRTAPEDVGRILGTLAYMSPEQTRGVPDEIDLRSDVYSLGIMLYELLTGRLPYDVSRTSVPAAVRAICEDPPRPAPELRGDLATVVRKALQKPPAERYQSVAALGEDIERYLANQPIQARPPSTAYQIQKLVSRHRLASALAGGLLLALIAFGAFSSYQARVIARERDNAKHQALEAEEARADATLHAEAAEKARTKAERGTQTTKRVQAVLVDLFKIADPQAERRNMTVDQVLARGEELVDKELGNEPLVQAKLLFDLAHVHENLGNADYGATLAERAVELYRSLSEPDEYGLIDALNTLAMLRRGQGKSALAEPLLREALQRAMPALGEQDELTLIIMNNLALVLKDQNRLAEAIPLYEQTLDAQRQAHGERHWLTLTTMDNLGRAYELQGQLPLAERHYRDAIAGYEIAFAAEAVPRPEMLTAMNNLANVLANQDRLEESEALHRRTLAGRTVALGEDHPQTFQSMNNLAFTLRREKKFDEAEELMRRAVEGNRRRLGDRHRETLQTLHNLAWVLREAGRAEEAEPLYRESLAGFKETAGENNMATFYVMTGLGECLTALQRYDEAERTLLEALAGLRRTAGDSHKRTRSAIEKIAALYEAWNRPDDADKYRAMLAASP